MKLNELMNEIYGGAKIRRGSMGPNVQINPDDHCLWYYDSKGNKIFPITFGDMLSEDWKIVG